MDLLPDDLVVAHLLPRLDITTRVRLAAVSNRWRTLSRRIPLPADADMPWILGFFGHNRTPSLLNLDTCLPAPPYHLPRPPSISPNPFELVGAVDGFGVLTTIENLTQCVALYSPFTGETRRIIPLRSEPPAPVVTINQIRILLDSGLVVIEDDKHCLLVARLGHFDWLDMNLPRLHDFIFYNGELFCITSEGDTTYILGYNIQNLIDNPYEIKPRFMSKLTKKKTDSSINTAPKDFVIRYLVECGGDLLVVTSVNRTVRGRELVKFRVRKLDFSRQVRSVSWYVVPLVEVNDLAESMLFLGGAESKSWSGIAADPSGLFVKNSIYFIHHLKDSGYVIGKFSMKSGDTGSNFAVFDSRRLNSWCFPVWISPHPRSIRF